MAISISGLVLHHHHHTMIISKSELAHFDQKKLFECNGNDNGNDNSNGNSTLKYSVNYNNITIIEYNDYYKSLKVKIH